MLLGSAEIESWKKGSMEAGDKQTYFKMIPQVSLYSEISEMLQMKFLITWRSDPEEIRWKSFYGQRRPLGHPKVCEFPARLPLDHFSQ